MNGLEQIAAAVEAAEDKGQFILAARELLASLSPWKSMPIDHVRWVPVDRVQANDYNPNAVAMNEMRLLHLSISADGVTQPIVTSYDEKLAKFIIIDGFHRYTTLRRSPELLALTNGCVPIVVLNKSLADRMAATVRHNRARGKHSVVGMGNIVFGMLDEGVPDEEICKQLGLEADELVRLKHVTGFSKLFENVEYRKAWTTKRQIQYAKEARDEGQDVKAY